MTERDQNGDLIYIIVPKNRTQQAHRVNITRLYGKGKEPTKEQLDAWNKKAQEIGAESKQTIYPDMQKLFGTKPGYICGDCFFFETWDYGDRRYFKCRKRGMSHSTASDIRKNDIACALFKKGDQE
jgi:hypothetical protein